MEIKKREIFEFYIAFILSIVSLSMYYTSYGIKNDVFFLSCAACFVRTCIMFFVLKCIEDACSDNQYSGAAFLLYSTVIYNSISSIKYTVDFFYSGAIDNLKIRAMGSLYIDLIIVICAVVFKKIHLKYDYKSLGIKNCFEIPSWITYGFVLIYSIISVYWILKYGAMLIANVSRTMRTFVSLFTYVTYAVSILFVRNKPNGRIQIQSILPLIILLFTNFYMTLVTGKKNILIVFVIISICGLLMTKKIQFKIAKYAAFLGPSIFQFFQTISEKISNREFYTEEYKLRYHAFRFDLSDLATTISIKHKSIDNPWNVLKEALEYSIPSVFSSNKNSELICYKNQMGQVGLNRDFDFNDSFFSMGAQIGGFLGELIVFLLIMIAFERLSYTIMKKNSIGVGVMVVLLSYFSSCESDWSMFIFQTRDIIIYILISNYVFKLIRKRRQVGEMGYGVRINS